MLNGRRIVLGPLVPSDEGALFHWLNDAETARVDFAYRPVHWATFRGWADGLIRDASRVMFAIRRLDNASLIGFVGLSGIDPVHRSADLAIRIGEEANRNVGYGSEALRLVLDFGWRSLNLHRVALRALARNERAIRAFQAVGFQREGVARSATFIDGVWHDIVTMGTLRPIPD